MTGALRTEFICAVNLSDSGLAGFLNIAEENNDKQRPKWCKLSGCTMELWNNDIDCLNRKVRQVTQSLWSFIYKLIFTIFNSLRHTQLI